MNDKAPEGQPPTAGRIYAPVILSMLSEEGARKASVEQRALSVITTSGALVSLLVALGALLVSKNDLVGSRPLPAVAIAGAVIAFVAAAILALRVNTPRGYRMFAAEDVARMLKEWGHDGYEAEWLVANAQAGFVQRAAEMNDKKAQLLQRAIALEVVGVTLVALAVLLFIM